MDKNQSEHQQRQGILLVAFALISQIGPEDFPTDIPEQPEEELPENVPLDEPEIDQDDLDQKEEIDLEGQEEVPELDEPEIDEEANDAEDVPVEPRNPPSDLNETTI